MLPAGLAVTISSGRGVLPMPVRKELRQNQKNDVVPSKVRSQKIMFLMLPLQLECLNTFEFLIVNKFSPQFPFLKII